MKKIKSAVLIVLILAALGGGIWGDRQLDARYSSDNATPETIIEATVE